jgi:hypothetical protein
MPRLVRTVETDGSRSPTLVELHPNCASDSDTTTARVSDFSGSAGTGTPPTGTRTTGTGTETG